MFKQILYTIATLLASLLAPLYLMTSARGRSRLIERFGLWKSQLSLKSPTYWVHGASLGEINSLLPLIDIVNQQIEEPYRILVTATSVSGLDRIEDPKIEKHLLPFDHPWFFKPALNCIDLVSYVFAETELWPSLMKYLELRRIPAALVNARISERSLRRYKMLENVISDRLRGLKAICCATEVARQRFLQLGAPEAILHVVGNSKFDLTPKLDHAAAQELKTKLFSHTAPIVVLGSLRPGEELEWFSVISKLIRNSTDINFIVAPRHKEKFDFFAGQLEKFQIEFKRASELQSACAKKVLLLDTHGQLEQMYSVASVAFVGGTLVDIGGHSPVEAAAYGVGMICGPYRHNIKEVISDLENAGAVATVKSGNEIENILKRLESDPVYFTQLGNAAKAVWQQNRGATARTLEILINVGVLPKK